MKSFHSNKEMLSLILFGTLMLLTNQTLLIASPAINPFDESKIPYSYANIGNIPYGKTLTFDLVENETLNLCESVSEEEKNHFLTPTYLLINANFGTCSFTTEAITAQELGAKGVIFVSDLVKYYDKIVQVDDGNGRKVHITVLFIDSQTYRKLHTVKNVHLKASFETHLTEKVNITYFLSASGRTNYIFLRQFQPYYQQIKDFVNFKPIYFTTKCENCHEKDCLISQDYCTFEMDEYKNEMGQYILKEQLRQSNLWQEKGTEKYLEYMDLFDKFCTVDWRDSEECGKSILNEIGVDSLKLKYVPSELMNEWKIEQIASGFLTTPEVTINEELYAGSYDPEELFYAACSSLVNPPSACTGKEIPHSSSKIIWIIGSIVLGLLIALIIGCCIYKKCIKKEMTEEIYTKVNELVAKYATEVQNHNKKGKDRLKMRLNEEL